VTPRRLDVHVDPRLCEGHGLCTELAPELFEINDIADVSDQHPGIGRWSAVHSAAAACPRQAIIVADLAR
jgi:ferredoxin